MLLKDLTSLVVIRELFERFTFLKTYIYATVFNNKFNGNRLFVSFLLYCRYYFILVICF